MFWKIWDVVFWFLFRRYLNENMTSYVMIWRHMSWYDVICHDMTGWHESWCWFKSCLTRSIIFSTQSSISFHGPGYWNSTPVQPSGLSPKSHPRKRELLPGPRGRRWGTHDWKRLNQSSLSHKHMHIFLSHHPNAVTSSHIFCFFFLHLWVRPGHLPVTDHGANWSNGCFFMLFSASNLEIKHTIQKYI